MSVHLIAPIAGSTIHILPADSVSAALIGVRSKVGRRSASYAQSEVATDSGLARRSPGTRAGHLARHRADGRTGGGSNSH